MLATLVVLAIAVVWSYWPALVDMVRAWNSNPDYSHGYLVLPIAVYFLWARRNAIASEVIAPSWAGIALLGGIVAIRYFSAKYYLGPVDSWTFPLSIAGIVLAIGGWRCLRWSLPSIAFLYFMIPIPYSAETWLSVPLQAVATKLATESLLLLGQPAIAEGNVIWIEDHPLMVAEACSGLRILVGISALAFAFVLFSSWSWWQKAMVLVATVPVALAANAARIVVTGLLHRLVSGEVAKQFSHDMAGLVMIPFAALLFFGLLVYVEALFPRVQTISPSAVVRSSGSDR
ncbi:exosortase/archaeosortase family protein [Botrimarina mediterranea]|nr:exosortase/archaeosortase family protein [Botrimarina mediterranea]